MEVRALFILGLALAGVAGFITVGAADLGHDEEQQQGHHLELNSNETTELIHQGCGGELRSSRGSLRHPLSVDYYNRNEDCTWVIRSAGPIMIIFREFNTERGSDLLTIRDGENRKSGSIVRSCTGGGAISGCGHGVTLVITSGTAHLHFTTDSAGTGTGFMLNWEPAEILVVVNPLESVVLECGIAADYTFCAWTKDDHIILVEDVYSAVYLGLARPETQKMNQQCSIIIESASTRDDGTWTCRIYGKGKVLQTIKNVVLSESPSDLIITPQQIIVNNGDRAHPKCVVESARPAADISWTLNGVDISSKARVMITPSKAHGSYKTVSTLKIDFNLEFNGGILSCNVRHHALANPRSVNAIIKVYGIDPMPKPRDVNIQHNISKGTSYEFKFRFSVTPKLTELKWYYGSNFQERSNLIQVPSESEKFAASLIDLNNGTFQVNLKLTSITEEDLKKRFTLQIGNGRIQANYKFMLSMDENPSECSRDFFMSYDAKHCYRLFRDEERNWSESQKKCRTDGLHPVQLSDEEAADVRDMVLEENGDSPVWLNAQVTNDAMVWNGSGKEIRKENPLWWPKTPNDLTSGPGDWLEPGACLMLLVYGTKKDTYPGRPYQPYPCIIKAWTLCEGVSPKPKSPSSEISVTKKLDKYCSGGWFFTSEGSTKCFVMFEDHRRNWDETELLCKAQGLLTAKPSNNRLAINLRKYILDKYGDGRVWLGARANGQQYLWEQDNSELDRGSSLWILHKNRGPWDDCHSHLGPKCGRTTPNHCLSLQVNRAVWRNGPDRPFASYKCSAPQYALCEYKDCPAGFFSLSGTTDCYKLLDETRSSWTRARSRCRDQGLRLAQPPNTSAVALRKFLVDKYVVGLSVWLGARRETVDSEVVWQHHQQQQQQQQGDLATTTGNISMVIPDDSSLWIPKNAPKGGQYSSRDDLCLSMGVHKLDLEVYPDQPYSLIPCAGRSWYSLSLCQAFNLDQE